MGDPKVKLTAAVFEQGQNEGIERTVLPLPQLSYLQNARMRKAGRIGKRFGYSSLSSSPGGTIPRCVGGSLSTSFAIVDDFCAIYDQTDAAFIPASQYDNPAVMPRVAGAVSGWLPDDSFFPVPARSSTGQDTTPCSTCYAFGHLWTAISYTDPSFTTDKMVRVVAVEPNNQTVVHMEEFRAVIRTFGGLTYPKMVLCGSTLVLCYKYTSAVGVSNIMGRTTASVSGGFSAEVAMTGAGDATALDISTYSSTQFLMARTRAAGAAVHLYAPGALGAPAATQLIAEANPATSVSVVGSASASIFVGYGITATTTAKVAVFSAALAGAVGTATLTTASASLPLLCLVSTGGVRAVYASAVNGTNAGSFAFVDVSALAALSSVNLQPGSYPISSPFAVGSLVYVWAKVETGGPYYPVLFRLPAPSGISPASCPIQMSPQDLLLTSAAFDLNGVPVVTQIGTSATYAMVMPVLLAKSASVGGVGVATGHEFRVVQTTHLTDSAPYRSLSSVFVDSASFVPMGTLTRVDSRGAVEEGFLHRPVVRSATPAAGGSLTASSDYYYTAVFKAWGENGRYEVSAPSDPLKVTMGAGQTQNTVSISQLAATQRASYSIDIYRTLSNDKTFYLVAVIDQSIGSTGTVSFVDRMADTIASVQPVLYTQVGQTLANTFPPCGRFACVGGGRLFVGGLTRTDVVHASKLILGDQSPSFADADAFRIVLPNACTGLAWCDSLVLFTAEGIYLATGDGPDDAGIGDFGTLTRLPFALGCIEPRSVIACDDGVFFQTARGLYLLPRGFGSPQAVDMVMGTLATYPIVCGVAALVKATEQTIRWVCVDGANNGAQLVYDLTHKVWGVDIIADPTAIGTFPAQFGIGPWTGGELAMFTSLVSGDGTGIKITNSGYSDNGAGQTMQVVTGDIRPFGPTEQGSVQRLSTLLELRSATRVFVSKVSDRGTAHIASRNYTAVPPDTAVGELSTLLTDLGSSEQRSISSLRVSISETSDTEGVALIAIALENGAPEGVRLNKPADRIV